MTKDKIELDAILRVDKLPQGGKELVINADEGQLKAIADLMQIERVNNFTAKLLITPIREGFIVNGKLQATITQLSIISLEPITQKIDENLKRLFLFGQEETQKDSSEIFIDIESDDLPDYYLGKEVDFSDFLLEILALAIDPFPKKEGERLEFKDNNEAKAQNSPFAKLKKLKLT